MKKRLFLLMLVSAVPVLFFLAWYMSQRAFSLSLAQEKQRTQAMESIVFQEVQRTTAGFSYAQAAAAARQYRAAYAAQEIELIFCWNHSPLAGAELPNELYEGLLLGRRAALLDTQSPRQRYAVAEPVTNTLTMILLKDVSSLYALRGQFRRAALLSALGASALLGLVSLAAAGFFTRPIRHLIQAAQALSLSSAGASPLPTGRRDEIGALARAFSDMRQAVQSREESLRRESEARQSLLDALAHELRTPLTSLLGNARLLQRDLPPADRERLAGSMAREIRRLSDMDQQLMKLTQLRHEPLEREPVALLPLLRETAERLKDAAPGIAIQVQGEDAALLGDRALLSLLADNLTVNALRASAPGDTVTLTALKNGFSVTDTGVGMTAEEIARACDPFWKADKARTRSQGGAGLGLSLCRRIAEAHGGALAFQSQPGAGTTVTAEFFVNSIVAVQS